jgi:hypothetical protein
LLSKRNRSKAIEVAIQIGEGSAPPEFTKLAYEAGEVIGCWGAAAQIRPFLSTKCGRVPDKFMVALFENLSVCELATDVTQYCRLPAAPAQEFAVVALAKRLAPESIELLWPEFLQSSNASVRSSAAFAARYASKPNVREHLELLALNNPSDDVNLNVLGNLAEEIANPERMNQELRRKAVEAAILLLTHKDDVYQSFAVSALSKLIPEYKVVELELGDERTKEIEAARAAAKDWLEKHPPNAK